MGVRHLRGRDCMRPGTARAAEIEYAARVQYHIKRLFSRVPAFTDRIAVDLTVTPQSELQRRIDEKIARLSDAANEQTNMAASEGVRLAAMKTLADMGVQANKIYINIHEDGEGGISISECEVQLDEQYRSRHTEIRGTLMERLGVNVVIGYEKGVTT